MEVKKVGALLLYRYRFCRRNWATGFAVTAAMLMLHTVDAKACASCGCTLSPDWEYQQITFKPGLKLDLRYDYIDQNELRHGTGSISPAAASQIVNNGNPQEVEKYTKNNYLTLGIDYSTSRSWGVNVQVPYILRSHSTLGTASDGVTPGPGGGQYDSRTSNLGDIKVIGRYQGFAEDGNFGVLYGLKLPTGSHTEMGTSTDPTAPGPVPIDRGLQPGTGTTDAILGGFYSNSINEDWDYFGQVMYQKALYSNNDYKPGDGLNVNAGVRYAGFGRISPQLQFNFRYVRHDEGANADTISTGGTLLYISPGFSAAVVKGVSVYSFVQLPLYQDVNGVQLAPRYTVSAGVRYAF
jgi:hypothetical protein